MFATASVARRVAYNSVVVFAFVVLVALASYLGLRTPWIFALVLIALLAAITTTWFVIRSITVPLEKVSSAADALSNGNLSVSLEAPGMDEIDKLTRSFQAIGGYLREITGHSSAIANGDLLGQIKPRSPEDMLGYAFGDMTEGLSRIVRSVRAAAAQVAAGAEQVAATSQETAQASVSTSSSIDELISAMEEMGANVGNVTKHTRMQAESVAQTSGAIDEMVASFLGMATNIMRLCDISDRSRGQVQEGMAAAARANHGLTQINTSISNTAVMVAALGERADSIGNIVEVIDDIAEQTNLLALNAAIEAARAGGHGLGFAVVADEVRKLAEKSAKSTSEIGSLIRGIQEETRKAVRNMEQSTSIVGEGLKIGAELTQALQNIALVVTEFNRLAQDIGITTNQQSEVSSRIAEATARLNQITEEISTAVHQQAEGTQSAVKGLAGMRNSIQKFRSSTVELAATAEQMTRMSRLTLDAVKGFAIDNEEQSAPVYRLPVRIKKTARAGAG
jgi:methyl-accepting chemotaxis protein